MSGWVVALGLGAGYLINRKLNLDDKLNGAKEDMNPPKEATGPFTTATIRKTYKLLDGVKYGDMNERLSQAEKDTLLTNQKEAASEVSQWDASQGSAPVEGVVLTMFS